MKRFLGSERGAAAAEYVLVLSLIGGSLAISVTSLGSAVADALERGAEAIAPAGDGQNGGNNGNGGNGGNGGNNGNGGNGGNNGNGGNGGNNGNGGNGGNNGNGGNGGKGGKG